MTKRWPRECVYDRGRRSCPRCTSSSQPECNSRKDLALAKKRSVWRTLVGTGIEDNVPTSLHRGIYDPRPGSNCTTQCVFFGGAPDPVWFTWSCLIWCVNWGSWFCAFHMIHCIVSHPTPHPVSSCFQHVSSISIFPPPSRPFPLACVILLVKASFRSFFASYGANEPGSDRAAVLFSVVSNGILFVEYMRQQRTQVRLVRLGRPLSSCDTCLSSPYHDIRVGHIFMTLTRVFRVT